MKHKFKTPLICVLGLGLAWFLSFLIEGANHSINVITDEVAYHLHSESV